mgnify:CR=1 FL=1
MTLRPSTMIAALNDWIESLTRHGFDRIYFLNGHGGNITTINAAFAEYYANFSLDGVACPVQLMQRNWWELPGIFKLCTDIYPEGHGAHATASEVAVTQYAYPEHIKRARMEPKIAPMGQIHDAAQYARDFPDGRIGSDPAQASPEKGQRIIDAAVPALIRDVANFTNEISPD